MAQQDLTVNFKVSDQGSMVLEKIKNSVSGISASLKLIDLSALTYLGTQIVSITEKALDFYMAGTRIQAVADSFNRVTTAGGIMSKAMVENMREASNYTITETDLMVKAQQLMIEGFSSQQIQNIMEASRVGAQKMGITVSEAFNMISEAIIRGNIRGAIREMFPMEAAQTFDAFARTIGSIGPNLSEAGRQQAVYNSIWKQTLEYSEKFGQITETAFEKAQQKVSFWKTWWEDVKSIAADAWTKSEAAIKSLAPKEPAGPDITWTFPTTKAAAAGPKPGTDYSAAQKQRLLDQEKVNALMIEERGILLNLNMEHAKSEGDISAELAITDQLAELEIRRLAQAKKLTPEIETQIRLHEADNERLILGNDTLKEVQRRISAMEANAEANWAVEQARIDLRKHMDDLKQQQHIEDLNYEQQIASLHGQDIEAIRLQEQAAISAATYTNKLYDTTAMKAYFELLKQNASDSYKLLQGTWDTISSSMSSNVTKMIQGQQDFKTSMLNIWTDISNYVIQALIRMALQEAMLGKSTTLSGAWSSGGGLVGLIGSLFHQEGGVFNQPTLGVIGEHGPEAVVPLKGGKVPVEGGQTIINNHFYNNNVNAVDAPSFIELCQRNPAGIMGAIKKDADSAGVMRSIIKELG